MAKKPKTAEASKDTAKDAEEAAPAQRFMRRSRAYRLAEVLKGTEKKGK